MSAEDPVETLKTILAAVSLKKDDNSAAKVGVVDSFQEDFYGKYDVLLAVEFSPPSKQTILSLGAQGRKDVVENYAVQIWTRTTKTISGRRILWDAVKAVQKAIDAKSSNPGGILKWMKVAGRRGGPRTDLKPPFLGTILVIETHRITSMENP